MILLTPIPSVQSNEYYPNRLYHTDEVVGIIRNLAASKNIQLVDNYKYITEYLEAKQLVIDDIIYGKGCVNDGLHPSDFMQKLIFKNIVGSQRVAQIQNSATLFFKIVLFDEYEKKLHLVYQINPLYGRLSERRISKRKQPLFTFR